MNYYRFIKNGTGIYEAVAKESPKDDPRRINKPDGSWLPKKGLEYPGAISFWKDFGLDKYIESGLLDWHISILKDRVEVMIIEKPNKILYEDEYQIIVNAKFIVSPKIINLDEFLKDFNKNYTGILIEESLNNKEIIKDLTVTNLKVTDDENPSDRWHIYTVSVTRDEIKKIQQNMAEGKWYTHFIAGDEIIVVYKDKMFEYKMTDKVEHEKAVEYGRSIGIPEEQLIIKEIADLQ